MSDLIERLRAMADRGDPVLDAEFIATLREAVDVIESVGTSDEGAR